MKIPFDKDYHPEPGCFKLHIRLNGGDDMMLVDLSLLRLIHSVKNI